MKTFDAFNIDEKEKLFLELAHLDELEIKFDLIKYRYELFYLYKDKWLFDQVKINGDFYIKTDEIWSVFELKFGLYWQEIEKLMTGMVEKYFKVKDYATPRGNANIII